MEIKCSFPYIFYGFWPKIEQKQMKKAKNETISACFK